MQKEHTKCLTDYILALSLETKLLQEEHSEKLRKKVSLIPARKISYEVLFIHDNVRHMYQYTFFKIIFYDSKKKKKKKN